jgi:hypothetical protein
MSSSAVSVSLALMLHESFHFLASALLGSAPTLITAFEMLGSFGDLTRMGLIVLGISGSVANVLLLSVGWSMLIKPTPSLNTKLAAWYLFSFNGMLITTKMIGESIFGFGDWITVAQNMSDPMIVRGAVLVLGVLGVVLMVRLSGKYLGSLLPGSDAKHNGARAIRIISIGALTSGAMVFVAAALRPVGIERTILLAIGAGLAPFVPMGFAVRVVGNSRLNGGADYGREGLILPFAAILCTLIFWLGFGRGISI